MLGLGLMLMNFCVEMVGVGRVRMRSLGRNREGWLVVAVSHLEGFTTPQQSTSSSPTDIAFDYKFLRILL